MRFEIWPDQVQGDVGLRVTALPFPHHHTHKRASFLKCLMQSDLIKSKQQSCIQLCLEGRTRKVWEAMYQQGPLFGDGGLIWIDYFCVELLLLSDLHVKAGKER